MTSSTSASDTRRGLACAVVAWAGCVLLALAGVRALRIADPLSQQLAPARAAAAHARMIVFGNSVADTSLSAEGLGQALYGDRAAVSVLAVPGGGRYHVEALARTAIGEAGLHPDVVLIYLEPAVWRTADLPTGDDRVRLLAIASPADPLLLDEVFGGSAARLAWAHLDRSRALLRDELVHGVARFGAASFLSDGASGAITPHKTDSAFDQVFAGRPAVPPPMAPPRMDAGWAPRILPFLVDAVRPSGAAVWLAEPVDPRAAPGERFTPTELREIAAAGCVVVPTPQVELPRNAMGQGAHVLPAYKETASALYAGWLVAHPPGSL